LYFSFGIDLLYVEGIMAATLWTLVVGIYWSSFLTIYNNGIGGGGWIVIFITLTACCLYKIL
jgi:hypothetical protein